MIKRKWDMFSESVSMSISNIKGNKMRTFLTTLGIIIGVAAIIALMTVVQGATDTMNAQFDAMGLGTLRVSVMGTAIKHGLNDDDLQAILSCEHVAGISPSLSATVTAKHRDTWSDAVSVNGSNDEYFRHNPKLLGRGRAIDAIDVAQNARVCLMDGGAARTLFFGEDPMEQTLYLDGLEYTVVGMINEDENASLYSQILMGGDTDGTVYVPYTSAKKMIGTSTVSAVEVYVTDPDDTDDAVDELKAALDEIFNKKDKTYTVINMKSMTDAMNLMTSMMTSLLVGIASIALVVGGIGIMNMMLVTVTERTTEIGLRKALGAEPGQIQMQFLIEAIILSLLGGVIGVVVGLSVSLAICMNTDITFTLNTFAIWLGDGSIKAGETKTILAPYSGVIGDYTAQVGDEASAGDALFTLKAQKVYAEFDGTVTAVFAQGGDNASSISARYGALAYIEEDVLYRAECSTANSEGGNENKVVHVGETVYIRSTGDSDRVGEARVIGVSGKSYTLEVTKQDDIRIGESIKVYRNDHYSSSSCIGSGKVERVDPQAVSAEGYVLSTSVEEGQHVSRGDVLFDIVPDALDDMEGGDGHVYMQEDGILLSVTAESGTQAAKDAVLATYCPKGAMRLICSVDEQDIAEIQVGDVMTVTLDAYEDKPLRGVVTKIAVAGEDGGAFYDVTLELEENDLMRIGMSASAEK